MIGVAGTSPGMTARVCEAVHAFSLGHFLERGRDSLAFVWHQRRLRRHGIADLVALDFETRLDAGGKVEARERLVDAPQAALQRHRLGPLAGTAEVLEAYALARNDARRPRHP